MLNFTIFGVPVRISPIFWIMPLIISGALTMQPGQAVLQRVLIYTLVIFFSILIHELGHALTGLKVGGGQAAIELNGFGGLAYNRGGRFTAKGRRMMIAMGPGAGFIFLAVSIVAMMAIYGASSGLNLASGLLFGYMWEMPSPEVLNKIGLIVLFEALLFVNFWWGVLNLLPIMPLDGGQLYETFSKSPKKVFQVGLFTAILVALWGLSSGHTVLAFLMGFLGYNNYRAMQEARY